MAVGLVLFQQVSHVQGFSCSVASCAHFEDISDFINSVFINLDVSLCGVSVSDRQRSEEFHCWKFSVYLGPFPGVVDYLLRYIFVCLFLQCFKISSANLVYFFVVRDSYSSKNFSSLPCGLCTVVDCYFE